MFLKIHFFFFFFQIMSAEFDRCLQSWYTDVLTDLKEPLPILCLVLTIFFGTLNASHLVSSTNICKSNSFCFKFWPGKQLYQPFSSRYSSLILFPPFPIIPLSYNTIIVIIPLQYFSMSSWAFGPSTSPVYDL